MENFTPIFAELIIPAVDKPTYQNLYDLFMEGHRIPMRLRDGTHLGYAHSCTIWSDDSIVEEGKFGMLLRFNLTVAMKGTIVSIQPVQMFYMYDGRPQFKFLSHFAITMAQGFDTKF